MNSLVVLTKVVLCALVVGACNNQLPLTYSVHDSFNEGQGRSIRFGHAEWCDVAGYCAQEVEWPQGELLWIPSTVPGHPRNVFGVQAEEQVIGDDGTDTYRSVIRFNLEHMYWDRSEGWRVPVLHEIGHICIDGHISGTIMDERAADNENRELSQRIVDAFWRGCE